MNIEFQKLVELQEKLSQTLEPAEQTPSKKRSSRRKKSTLSDDQLRALTLAANFGLLRGRSFWMARTEFYLGDRRNKKSRIRAITIRKLWEKGYLTGVPDLILIQQTKGYDQGAYLVASEAGKALLQQLRANAGIYFDLKKFEVVRLKRRGIHPVHGGPGS
jgi:hypothetical protein